MTKIQKDIRLSVLAGLDDKAPSHAIGYIYQDENLDLPGVVTWAGGAYAKIVGNQYLRVESYEAVNVRELPPLP